MPYFEDLYHETYGDKNRPTVMFLHGFLGNGGSWHEIIQVLKRRFFCITVDMPGHGKSLSIDESWYKFSGCAKLLIRMLDKMNRDRFSLVGYSMGGRSGLYLALNYPDRIDKLVLESSSPGLKTKKEQRDRQRADKKLAQELKNGTLEDFLRKWYSQPLFESLKKDKKKFEAVFKERQKNDGQGLAASLRHTGTGVQESLWGKLKELYIPTLLIVGEYDLKFQAIAKKMSAKSEKIKVNCVSGAGHNVHFEKPPEYARILAEFLE